MPSSWLLALVLTLIFEGIAPQTAFAQASNVLAPVKAPRATFSPPSNLRKAAVAPVPRAALSVKRALNTKPLNVLPLARVPRAVPSPPSALHRTTRGFAVGKRLQSLQRTAVKRGRLAIAASAATTLISEAFSGTATTSNAWVSGQDACITAGSSLTTPATSVPACGANAAQELPGSGALQLTPPINYQGGYVFNNTPIATSGGLSITFNYYSFNSSSSPGDGLALVLTDASKAVPGGIAGCCGSLGYAPYDSVPPLPNGYLGIGLDETGFYSAANEDKTGGLASLVANTITVRGAAATNAAYLFGAQNAAGQAAALPFSLDTPAATARPAGLTVNMTLTAAGLLSVSIDRHDGTGLVAYIAPTQVVGVNGQPALPATLYVGFVGAGGGANTRHQINNVVVTGAAAAVTPTPPPVLPPVVTESFTGTATTPSAWAYGDNACLTAGTSSTPATSISACGANAPQDSAGGGALQLTPPINFTDGFAFDKTPFATSGGLSITFNYYSFNTSSNPGDGLALVLTDASQALPSGIGGCCGSLGYATHNGSAQLANGYLAVGLDETGFFTANNEGKTGGIAALLQNAITVRGAVSTNAQYLFSAKNTSGQAASLPFAVDTPSATTRPTGLAVNVTLTPAGLLSVAIDRHDGIGAILYIPPTQVVGVNGQPALPANVYFGFIAAGGGANTRHQISNVSVTGASGSSGSVTTGTKTSVLTYHNDSNRTGWNPNETVLSTANVNSSTFGLLHTVALDGRVDAQPLVVPNQSIDGQGVHDVVYVATENDTIYAIDAESGAVLQSRNLGLSIPNTAKDYDDNIYPLYGITGTPVIDPLNNAIYLVTDTNEGASAPDVYRLHKLALNNLSDLVASAMMAPATTLGDGSTYVFAAQHERQHPGLLEANGYIYVAFGSTGDTVPAISRGIVAGFSAANLTPLASDQYTDRLKEVTNPFYLSSVWQSGYGIAADSQGNLYFSTGNSDPGTPSYGPPYNYPDSALKVAGNLSSVLDSFTQYNYFSQDISDGDFGSGGTMVVPDQAGIYPHLIVAGGKDGLAYILNRDNLGGFTPNGPNKDLAELSNGGCWCGPAYFVGADAVPRIVTGGGKGIATWRLVDGSSLNIALEGRVSPGNTNGQPDYGGSVPAVSSNGTVAGSAILWFVQKPNETNTYTLTLRAYNAANLSTQLFASSAGNWTNQNSNANAVPTVANGYVYVASYRQMQIFGLLGH
jgi:hypothetical protein